MIGMNLKYFREKYGYSQEELAERFDVSSRSVAKWESEESLPDVERCIQVYDTTVEMLFVCPFYKVDSVSEPTPTADGDGKYISA